MQLNLNACKLVSFSLYLIYKIIKGKNFFIYRKQT